MFPEIQRTLVTRDEIASRIGQMARRIAEDLSEDLRRDGHSAFDQDRVVLIPIMTGAMIFAADLIREMPLKLSIGLVTVSSYSGQSVSSKGAQLASALPDNLAGKHVLVIDDILDSGQTLALVRAVVWAQHPASLRIAVLLDKKTKRVREVPVDYVGFEIPDEFVVGYGLDYDGYYRNHPEIVVLDTSVLDASERRG
jgi:hypoxanthine phosphoribosyltransferase